MKRIVLMLIFIVGLCIFLYPVVSDWFATTAHQSVIQENREVIEELDEAALRQEKEKVSRHNQELTASDLNFVDPFDHDLDEESQGNSSYYDALNLGPSIGTVRIPKIDVELPIYHGTSEEVLSKGAGHLENSSLPSGAPGTHSVITAHRGLPSATMFRHLDELKVGDQFYIEVLDEVLAYEVETIDVVLPSETSWLTMEEGMNQVTLLTCDPYMINTHRMLVTGKQIPYVPDQVAADEVPDDSQVAVYLYWIIGGIILTLLLLLVLWKRRKRKGTEES